MAQLRGVGVQAMLPEEAAPGRAGAAGMRLLFAFIVASAVLVTTTGARAQEAQSPQDAEKIREQTDCTERLKPLEKAIEKDGHYASAWRDVWLVTGAGGALLSLSGAFAITGYRRAEGLVGAVQSLLLMIQKPDAVANARTLEGIRGVETLDPCLALLDARNVLAANEADWQEHPGKVYQHIIAISVPIVIGALVAGATGHWDFVGNGNEGLQTLIGVAISETQLLTWPRPSIKTIGSVQVGATSLTVRF
jgi:hypothetical protein